MRKAIAVASTAILLAVGSVAVASHNFTDVDEGNIFHDDIAWMYDNGITYGYGDGTYGPKDFMTREQMAAFMHRLYNRIQRDIPEVPSTEAIAEAFAEANINIASICEIFDLEPGDECQEGLAEILQGPAGPQGPEGPAGKNGDRGKDGVSGYRATNRTARVGGEGDQALEEIRDGVYKATRTCPDGKVVTGGGLQQNEPKSDYTMIGSYPDKYSDGLARAWSVEVKTEGHLAGLLVWAVCVDIAG